MRGDSECGNFPTDPSPPNNRSAFHILKDHGLDACAKSVMTRSVHSAVLSVEQMTG